MSRHTGLTPACRRGADEVVGLRLNPSGCRTEIIDDVAGLLGWAAFFR
jgi:hypothetical protein